MNSYIHHQQLPGVISHVYVITVPCKQKADVVFIIDASASINGSPKEFDTEGWPLVVTFLKDLAKQFTVAPDGVGVNFIFTWVSIISVRAIAVRMRDDPENKIIQWWTWFTQSPLTERMDLHLDGWIGWIVWFISEPAKWINFNRSMDK